MTEEPPEENGDGQTDETAASETVGKPVDTTDLIEGYHATAEWIRFADAKAAVVLTVGAAVSGLVVPTLKKYLEEDTSTHPFEWWSVVVGITFGLWLLFLLLSGINAFLCIQPFRRRGRHPALEDCKHFHPAAIAANFGLDDTSEFSRHLASIGDEGLRREVAACILIDSHISSVKYQRVTTSIRLMGISAITGLTYLVLIQF